MNLYLSIVADESKFAEFVHKVAHARSGRSNHLSQCFLANIQQNRLRYAFRSKMREQKKKAGEPLLAGIKKLVDQILFNSAIPCQEIRHEQLGKFRLGTQGSNHRFFGD